MASPCWTCRHRRPIPGDAHVQCAKAMPEATGSEGVPFILRLTRGNLAAAAGFLPVRRTWPGSGIWPLSYDAATVLDCPAYRKEE